MKTKFLKDKKADIPITILVLGVLAICALTIISFIISSKSFNKSDSSGVEIFEEIHTDVEKFYFYLNADFSKQEAVELVNQPMEVEVDSPEKSNLILDGNRLIMERSNDFILVRYVKNLE